MMGFVVVVVVVVVIVFLTLGLFFLGTAAKVTWGPGLVTLYRRGCCGS